MCNELTCMDRANLAPETFSNLNLDYYICKKKIKINSNGSHSPADAVGETEDQVNQLITSGSWLCEPALYFFVKSQ